MTDRIDVVDLFSGAGGLALGFEAAGCTVTAAVDIDEMAAETFGQNFAVIQPENPPLVVSGQSADLGNLEPAILIDAPPTILIGGPPCQGFSKIGRGKLASLSEGGFAADPRNSLYKKFLDAAGLWQPQAVVMENVPGMLSVSGTNVAEMAAADLADVGYRVGFAVLNAVWYGVPQYRERLFFVGIREDLGIDPSMPRPTHRAALPSGYMPARKNTNVPLAFRQHRQLPLITDQATWPATSVADAIEDLPVLTSHLKGERLPHGGFRRSLPYHAAPRSRYAQLMRQWPGLREVDSIDDHVVRRTPRDYETFERMKPGDRYPQALAIARKRFETALRELKRRGDAPEPATKEYKDLERRFIPPYPQESFVDKWRKLVPDRPSWTIVAHLAKDGYSHIHHDSAQARSISVREAARLQSFPDAFRFAGNMGQCFQQIGNAVPPLLSWAIAHEVLRSLRLPSTAPPWLGQPTEHARTSSIRPEAGT